MRAGRPVGEYCLLCASKSGLVYWIIPVPNPFLTYRSARALERVLLAVRHSIPCFAKESQSGQDAFDIL